MLTNIKFEYKPFLKSPPLGFRLLDRQIIFFKKGSHLCQKIEKCVLTKNILVIQLNFQH